MQRRFERGTVGATFSQITQLPSTGTSLLTRVPDKQLVLLSLNVHLFDLVVDANRCDERGVERLLRESENKARLTNGGISDSKQLPGNGPAPEEGGRKAQETENAQGWTTKSDGTMRST